MTQVFRILFLQLSLRYATLFYKYGGSHFNTQTFNSNRSTNSRTEASLECSWKKFTTFIISRFSFEILSRSL